MPDYNSYRPRDLQALLKGVHRAVVADRTLYPHWEYGVWVFPDWRIHARAIEAALKAHNQPFVATGL